MSDNPWDVNENRRRLRGALSPVLDFGYEDMPDKQDEAIAGVLAIVRELLLSDQSLRVVAKHLDWADAYSETMQTEEDWMHDARSLVVEQFDTVMNEIGTTVYAIDGDVGYRITGEH